MNQLFTILISITVFISLGTLIALFIFSQYKKTLREAKNYERGLKMVPMLIHLPPSSDDIEGNGRDQRDIIEEVLSQAQVMYNIISSTATKGFKSKLYGQRHIAFEIIAHEGLVRYYTVVPSALVDVVRQAIVAAYPSARLEEVVERNIFSQIGKMSGTIGGEFTLKKSFVYPIATFQETKRDASRALLNALSSASREDGIAIQLLMRPASDGWTKSSVAASDRITKHKGKRQEGLGDIVSPKYLMDTLWKGAEKKESKQEDKQLSKLEQTTAEAIEEKTRYPGYEVLIRVVVSSNTAARSQALLKNVVAAFALFDSQTFNGFKFAVAKNIDELVTAYIFRFFPQAINQNIINSVELATIFHLPDQKTIPTSQVQRQLSKQVDGPTQIMEEGFLLGYNEFRGIKKPIRLSTNDRRRHTYIIGQTGTGKSVLLENLAFQDMMEGRGFALIDPHGDLAESLLGKVPKERVEDVIYFNPGDMAHPMGLNMFEFDHPDQKDFLVQEAINMLYGLYDPGHTGIVGPRLEHIFRNCALLLMSDPNGGTFIDIPKLLIDNDYMKSKLKHVTDQTVLDFWTKEYPESKKSSESGEVVSWVVSKFGPFISNDAMRNIIGQTKSSFNLREIMDNKKILLVNLSKGRMGELNSKLLGIIFVMKFQAAAMSRADIKDENQRVDFSLYVDEFQNFATDSFESILSEARKYRLNLIMGNQFMTQLTEKIREAIIGNVGTVIGGRIGITDAELLVKKFAPTFDAEDLTKLPNYQSVASVMINNVPSAPFSMSFVPPMGQPNPELVDALKKLSASRYSKTRAEVEKEIFERLGVASGSNTALLNQTKKQQEEQMTGVKTPGGGSSFLDEWLMKRKNTASAPTQPASVSPASNNTVPAGYQAQSPQPNFASPSPYTPGSAGGSWPSAAAPQSQFSFPPFQSQQPPFAPPVQPSPQALPGTGPQPYQSPFSGEKPQTPVDSVPIIPTDDAVPAREFNGPSNIEQKLHLRGPDSQTGADEVSVKLR